MAKESLSHPHPEAFCVVTKKDWASTLIEDTCIQNTM